LIGFTIAIAYFSNLSKEFKKKKWAKKAILTLVQSLF
jgi:hypothetical protein